VKNGRCSLQVSNIAAVRYLLLLQASLPSPDSVSARLHKFASILEEVTEEWEQRLEAVSDFQVGFLDCLLRSATHFLRAETGGIQQQTHRGLQVRSNAGAQQKYPSPGSYC